MKSLCGRRGIVVDITYGKFNRYHISFAKDSNNYNEWSITEEMLYLVGKG